MLQDLTAKTLKELKALAEANLNTAFERGIHHEGDKRQRQTWIDFLERCANTDIDVSEKVPGEIQAQALTIEAAENFLDAEVEPVEAIDSMPPYRGLQLAIDALDERGGLGAMSIGDRIATNGVSLTRISEDSFAFSNAPDPSLGVEIQAQALTEPAENSLLDAEPKFGRITYPQPAQKPIAQTVKSEPKVSQSAIAQTAENYTGVTGSDHPWTDADRWNPADFGEVLHKADSNGQLNLLEWDTNEPPDPDDYDLTTDFQDAYDRWLVANPINEALAENNEANTTGISTESVGADEIAIAPELPTGRDSSSKPDRTCSDNQNEALGSQKGDRILEGSGADSGSAGRVPSHRTPELTLAPNITLQAPNITPQAPNITPQAPNITPQAPNITPQAPNITPQAAFNDEQPPNRGDGRKSGKLAIGMQVGRKGDRQHAGTILNIYHSKRGKLRAKVQPLNKANFVYFDYDNLIEQKLLYDYEMKPGGFVQTGSTFDNKKGEPLEVWTRKLPPIALAEEENWTLAELAAKPIWQVKAIAKRCCDFIPGKSSKRSLIRAILAEQQLRAIAREKDAPLPQSVKPAKTNKQTAQSEPFGQQLSLNLFTAAA